jgi:DNA processing protein
MTDDLGYWLALVRFRPFGAVSITRLHDAFANMQTAFEASAQELVRAGIDDGLARRFVEERAMIDPAKELDLLREHEIRAVTLADANYPEQLKAIHDPPAVLFVRGSIPDSMRPHMAVVGSRHPTAYGKRAAAEIVGPSAAAGVVIVSGLALGIDAIAHEAALEHRGTTIAVLGSSIEDANVYPSHNRRIASRILSSGGALLTEFPIGTHALPQYFPFRNRIISGLCRATLVVEAAQKSGSLITAKSALEQNRDVFAVPGSIHSELSAGPNNLLKMGATPVTCADDVFHHLGMPAAKKVVEARGKGIPTYAPANATEQAIVDCLSAEPMHNDEIVRACSLPASAISAALTLMEMKGAVRHIGGMHYVKI